MSTPVFSADQYSEITIAALGSSATIGPVIRGSLNVNTQYFVLVTGPLGSSGAINLFKKVVGAGTQIGTSTQTVNVGDKIRLRAQGTTIAVDLNGSQIISVTDAAISSGIPGCFCGPSGTLSSSQISLWTGGNVTAGPTFTQLASDNFTRANENPLTPLNWFTENGYSSLQVVSNLCEATGLTGCMELFFGQTFDALLPNTGVLAADSFFRGNASGSGGYNGNWLLPNTADAVIQTLNNVAAPGSVAICSAIYTNVTTSQTSTTGGLPAGSMWPNDQWCSAQIIKCTGTDVFGLLLRSDQGNSTQTYYLFFLQGVGASQTAIIRKYVSGAITNLATGTVSINIGDHITFAVRGTTLTAYVNGVSVLTVTDGSISSGSPGLLVSTDTSGLGLAMWRGGGFNLAGPLTVFIGDSIISRWDLSTQFPGKNYCNCGIGSQTSSQILLRFPLEVLAQNPSTVVIEGGRNGFQQGTETVSQTTSNFASMGALARAAGINVVYTTTIADGTASPDDTDIDALNVNVNAFTNGVKAQWNQAICNQTTPTSPIAADYLGDLIHPNTTGYSLLASVTSAAIAVAGVYSVPDCRAFGTFPNHSRNVQGTNIFDVPSVDSRAAGAPVDSRTQGAPVDSRATGLAPQNSRTPGTYGPGVN